MIQKSAFAITALLITLLGVQACGPVGLAVGAGAASGVAAYQERGIEGVARDLKTSSHILDMFIRKQVGVEVYEGRVLLTGQVDNEQLRAEAVRLSWTASGTKDVLNEIHVTLGTNFLDTARDGWITTQLEAKLTFDEQVFAINYTIETVGGIVYLIGIAQSQEELDRVKNQAKSIEYVQYIISHVRVKDPSEAPAPTPIVEPAPAVKRPMGGARY